MVELGFLPAVVMLLHSIPVLAPVSLRHSISSRAAPALTVRPQSVLCVWAYDINWMYLFMVLVLTDLSA